MSDLLDLAARCEAASGADRELDAAIWLACVPGATRKETRYFHGFTGKECVIDETRENYRLIIVPAYTTSLNAALTLVPEGWNWMAGNRNLPLARAYVNNGELSFEGAGFRRNPKHLWFEVVAVTPALALCAAALRARTHPERAAS